MTIRAKGGRDCVLINGIALEARASVIWEDEGTPFETLITWDDAVKLRDMLTDQISLYQKDMTDGEGEE